MTDDFRPVTITTQPRYNDMIEIQNSDGSIYGRGYVEDPKATPVTFRFGGALYEVPVEHLAYDGTHADNHQVFVVPIGCIRKIGRLC